MDDHATLRSTWTAYAALAGSLPEPSDDQVSADAIDPSAFSTWSPRAQSRQWWTTTIAKPRELRMESSGSGVSFHKPDGAP